MKSNLECAMRYVAKGWKVFPLTPGTKVPLEGSKGHREATNDPDTVYDWWTDHPNCNIGIATGEPSGVWVIDIDNKNDKNGTASLKAFMPEDADPLDTFVVKTPSGGAHIYVAFDPAHPVSNRADVLSGIDIRGTGGYVVAPPSKLPNGQYRAKSDVINVAPAPKWAVDLYEHDSRSPTGRHSDRSNKVDKSTKLAWDMCLGFRHNPSMTLKQTTVNSKYICRCPFHDDGSASAFFKRVDGQFGYLFCSACDTTWVTETSAPKSHIQRLARDNMKNLIRNKK